MGYVDIHMHVLPQLDDGAQNMEMTLEMLRIAEVEGITHIIATPHYRTGHFPANSNGQRAILNKVQQLAREQGIGITLYLGNEIYYRSELDEKFRNGRLCSMNGSDYVLVEFSPLESFLYIRNAMDDLFGMGYIPILAHAERYQCMCKKWDYIREIRDMGCDIQVNAASVIGENGFVCKHFVHNLLKHDLVDYIGTDAHNTSGRRPAMKKCAELLYKKYERSYVDALLFGNARERLLEEEKHE